MQQVVKGVDEQGQQGSKEHLQWPWSTDHNDFWYVESCRDLTHWYWSFTPCLATLVTCHCTLWNADLVGIVKSVHCFSSSADNNVLFQSAYRHRKQTDRWLFCCMSSGLPVGGAMQMILFTVTATVTNCIWLQPRFGLRCFDAVGWAAGRASGL